MILPARILIDTGPLVAWLDASDPWNGNVAALLAHYRGELLSTWPVITEVRHLVPERQVAHFLR
jgi:predicted nucleic acid-binding protein